MKRGFLGWIVAGAAVAAAPVLLAQTPAADADRSPFLPPDAPASNADLTGPNGIELHGIMSTASGTSYNIYSPQKKTSVWIGLNHSVDGVTVKSADPRSGTITVDVNGQVVPLALKESKISQGIALSPVAMANMVLQPTPQDEQKRLQAVADEVRRRRLLRQQAERGQNPQ